MRLLCLGGLMKWDLSPESTSLAIQQTDLKFESKQDNHLATQYSLDIAFVLKQ